MQPRHFEFNAPDPDGGGFHAIRGVEWGDRDNPKTVLCVHGLTRNARDFDFLARELARDFRVIAPSVAGRGKSEWLKNHAWYSYPLYVSDVLAMAEHMNIKNAHWVGTSMGGIIGMMIAAVKPDLMDKVVLNDIGAFIPADGLNRIGVYVRDEVRFKNEAEMLERMKKIFAPFGLTRDDQWRHLFDHSVRKNQDGSYSLDYDPAIGKAFKDADGKFQAASDIELWHFWNAMHHPVLLVRGADSDILLKQTADEMLQSKKGAPAELAEFQGFGHAPPLMQEDQIRLVKNWLLK